MSDKNKDQNAISKWAEREIKIAKQLRAAEARIDEIEVAAGRALLNEEDAPADSQERGSASAFTDVAAAHAEVRTLKAALKACRQVRLDAISRARAGRAGDLRSRAHLAHGEVETINAKAAKLLSALGNLQGITYTPLILASQPSGDMISQGYQQPRSVRLQAEFESLMLQAEKLDQSQLQSDGHIQVPAEGTDEGTDEQTASVDDLVLAVLSQESIVPPAQEVFSWVEAVESQSHMAFGNHHRVFHLYWKDGKIDASQSNIQVLALRSNPGPWIAGTPAAGVFKSVGPQTGERGFL